MANERRQADAKTRLWLHFLWSFALADHLGDACDAMRAYAEAAGFPMPGNYAELSVDPESENYTPEGSWMAWIESQGVNEGIHSDAAKVAKAEIANG